MSFTPRLALLALLFLVVPAAVTALFLARNARPPVATGAQPGGVLEGRIEPFGPTGDAAIEDVVIVGSGVGERGATVELARTRTGTGGRFSLAVPPFEGRYDVRVAEGAWQVTAVAASLLGHGERERAEIVVPVRAAARLELAFVRRSGAPVHGGRWTIEGETARSWFSSSGSMFGRTGSFDGANLVVEGLPTMRATVRVRLDGGDRTELVIDLAIGMNRHTVEL